MVYTTKALRHITLKHFVSSSYLNPSLYLTLGLITLTILTGINLSSINVSADDTVLSDVAVSIPLSCNMEATVNTPHTATINAGTYQADIGTTTFKVTCNDHSGYSIYAIGYTNNEFGNTKLLATVNGTLAPTYDIVTGTAISGSTSNWAMKLTPVTGTYAPTIESDTNGSFSSYHIVPSTYTKVPTFPSSTDTITGSSMQATYAAFIAIDQPAGSYDGKVRYTLVHPANERPASEPKNATARCISYWPNASGVVDNMGDQCTNQNYQQLTNNMADVMLWPTNFKRPGYGFAGWSDKFDWVLNENDANGNGTGANAGYHIYGPMQSITTPADMTTKGLSLYAVWVKSAGNLQGFNCPNNTTMPIGTVTALKDARDDNVYTVAKLADGKCWMTENMRLDYTANITPANTQSTNNAFGGVFSSLAEPETANFADSTTANSLYKSDGSGDIKGVNGATLSDIGTSNDPGYRFPRYRNDNTNTNSTINPNTTVANQTNNSSNIYSYGNYYTWAAAIADTGYYSTNNQTVATSSICPTGWHLPKGGSSANATNSEFWQLGLGIMGNPPSNNSSYQSETNTDGKTATLAIRSFPNNFLYSGYVYGSSVSSRGSVGDYWSSTAYNNGVAYGLYLVSSVVYPGTDYYAKYRGFTVRCVAGN